MLESVNEVTKNKIMKFLKDNMVMRADFEIVKKDVDILKQDVSVLKQDVSVLKTDMLNVKGKINTQMVTKDY